MEIESLLPGPELPERLQSLEECFEDPFALRLMPDAPRFQKQSRFFCLGRNLSGQHWMIVYAPGGKTQKVVGARPMTERETEFYTRKAKEMR